MALTVELIDQLKPKPKRRNDKVMYYDYKEVEEFIYKLKLIICENESVEV